MLFHMDTEANTEKTESEIESKTVREMPIAKLQRAPFLPTTHINNADGQPISWDEVRKQVETFKMTIPECADHYKISESTIRNRANRQQWKMINAHIMNKLRRKADWTERQDAHRDMAFKVAHESMKKFKAKAPKNFRELEAADKIARRAAGLDTSEVVQQTLIQVNEAIDAGEAIVQEVSALTADESSEPMEIEDQPAVLPDTAPVSV